jgi:hypothetical protein
MILPKSLCHGRHHNLVDCAHKTKDRVTRTQLRQGVISGVPEGQTVPAPLVTLVVVI